MYYSSINNDFIKNIKNLHTKKYRDLTCEFLIEGEHLVNEAIKNNIVKYVILEENTVFDTDIKIIKASKKVLKYITNLESPQPVMAVCEKIKEKNVGNKIMILDNIQDPGNLGTIIRSANAFGFNDIILSKTCVKKYNDKVLRATQGMIFSMNVITKDLTEFIPYLKENGYSVYGTDVVNGKNVCDVKQDKIAVVMGSEGQGLSKEVKDLIDKNIYIKMNDSCESLNVAVASSIIMYELNK